MKEQYTTIVKLDLCITVMSSYKKTHFCCTEKFHGGGGDIAIIATRFRFRSLRRSR